MDAKSPRNRETSMHRYSLAWAASLVLLTAAALVAQDKPPTGKPVPRMQVLPLPRSEASIQDDGREITRFIYDPALNRPFLYPVIGPSGRSVTRMGHPHDPNSHSHHNSVWVSHHIVDGVDFWGDSGKGRIVQRRVVQFDDSDGEALIQTENDWLGENDKVLLKERRTMRVQPLANKEWRLILDLELTPPRQESVTLGKTPFGLVGVRMAKTIGVHDGGGTIRNSEGGVNEKGVFWKPARWVDYSGPMTRDTYEGIALMDHPSNPNHPTVFHVRDDGWMGASLTFAEDRVIQPGQPLKLRYGLYVHGGLPSAEELNEQFAEFAKIGDPPSGKK
jgi:hypothetical protein